MTNRFNMTIFRGRRVLLNLSVNQILNSYLDLKFCEIFINLRAHCFRIIFNNILRSHCAMLKIFTFPEEIKASFSIHWIDLRFFVELNHLTIQEQLTNPQSSLEITLLKRNRYPFFLLSRID